VSIVDCEEVPFSVSDWEAKEQEMFEGSPAQDRFTAPWNPLSGARVSVTVPLPPAVSVRDVGFAVRMKSLEDVDAVIDWVSTADVLAPKLVSPL
jgi:hypothetical protein